LDWGSARPKAATYTQDNTNTEYIDIHALSGIRTHDPSVEASEYSSCLRLRGHRHIENLTHVKIILGKYMQLGSCSNKYISVFINTVTASDENKLFYGHTNRKWKA
jgi:hypothetical protein